jgi:hypothetical protein
MQQILRLCEVVPVERPTETILTKWLGRNLKSYESIMDLRQLLRGDETIGDAKPITVQQITTPADENEIVDETPETYNAAWFSLYGTWDIYGELNLETKDANLAGLLFHQNLPKRLKDEPQAWMHYKKLHSMCSQSDLADYWAFFHQCWILLNISNNFKLKFPNQYLQDIPYAGTIPEPQSLEYTWVLTKQSALFNTWKEMLRLNEQSGVGLRLISDYSAIKTPNKYTSAIALVETQQVVVPVRGKKAAATAAAKKK